MRGEYELAKKFLRAMRPLSCAGKTAIARRVMRAQVEWRSLPDLAAAIESEAVLLKPSKNTLRLSPENYMDEPPSEGQSSMV